jgi:hypothetical protein
MSLAALERMQPRVDRAVQTFLHKHFWGPRIPRARVSKRTQTTVKKPKLGPAVPFLVQNKPPTK